MAALIESLEQTLRIWEDQCLIANLLGRMQSKRGEKQEIPLHGPFLHYDKYRSYILKSFDRFNIDEFCDLFIEDRSKCRLPALGDLVEVPYELAVWNYTSRRVYHLKSDLQFLLNATSVKNICWKHVRLPFQSFAVILDEPIIGDEYKEEYDCILVTSYFNNLGYNVLTIRLINSKVRDYQPISEDEKRALKIHFKNSNFQKLIKCINICWKRTPQPLIIPHYELPLTDEILNSRVTDSIIELVHNFVKNEQEKGREIIIADEVTEMPQEGNTAIRIIVGLCLFLTTRQFTSATPTIYRCKKQKRTGINQPRPIVDESEIFKLTLSQNLTLREKSQYSQGLKYESRGIVDPHFRQGVWRFPPNQANKPGAEKTVWVRPSFVNSQFLSEGELPNGCSAKIKKS